MNLASPLFRDRAEAGERVAEKLRQEAVVERDVLVLALPRGGVPVGFKIAQALHADLDAFVVRKLGLPGHEELAMGAIASGGRCVLNEQLIVELGITPEMIERVAAREQEEIHRREELYRRNRPKPHIAKQSVILVDDGLATGASMRAAALAVRAQEPKRIVIAVPVASREAWREIWEYADDVVCVAMPEPFSAVGAWYENFAQVSDAEVQDLLQRGSHERVA